jgi:hypothetical protein
MTWAAAFGLNFVYIFLKAIQQLNVVHNQFRWVVPTSILMGVCEVGIVLLVVRVDSLYIGIINGIGAGLGAVTAIITHRKFIR